MKFIVLLVVLVFSSQTIASLIMYTDRPKDRMQIIVDKYEKNSGEKVEIFELTADEIIEKAKDPKTVADIYVVKDGVYLQSLKSNNLLALINSSIIKDNVLPMMRDDDGAWTFISFRARTLVYDASLDVSQIKTYANLAEPQLAGTLCLRQGTNVYNVGLVAGMIVDYGSDKAKEILTGILANRVEPISYPNDTAVLNAIASGKCALGITHSYYLGLLLSQQPNFPVALKFLDMASSGVHINGTGAGVARNSKQIDRAQKFIEYMVSNDEVQIAHTNTNFEYPVKKGLAPESVIKGFGVFTPNGISWTSIGSKTAEALDLINLLGYD